MGVWGSEPDALETRAGRGAGDWAKGSGMQGSGVPLAQGRMWGSGGQVGWVGLAPEPRRWAWQGVRAQGMAVWGSPASPQPLQGRPISRLACLKATWQRGARPGHGAPFPSLALRCICRHPARWFPFLYPPLPTRFGRGQEASRAMGQPWSSDRANKHWGRGVTISKTEYLRPQYLPRAYEPPRKH